MQPNIEMDDIPLKVPSALQIRLKDRFPKLLHVLDKSIT
jgi:hypothetical protein